MKNKFFIISLLLSINLFSQKSDYNKVKSDSLYALLFGNSYNEQIRYIKDKHLYNEYKFTKEQEEKILHKCLANYLKNTKKETDSLKLSKNNYSTNLRVGIIYYKLKKYYKSIEIFEKILNEKINSYYDSVSIKNLIELYILTKKYKKALELNPKIDDRNISYTCLNAEVEELVYRKLIKTKIYSGLNNYEKALDEGVPLIFNGYSNKELTMFTFEILLKKYTKTLLKKKLDRAISELKRSKKERKYYKLEFLNREIELGLFSTNNISEIDKLKLHLKTSMFYKLITE